MKKFIQFMLILSFSGGMLVMGTSCNNAGKNNSKNADSLSAAANSVKDSFSSQVSGFDSTWSSTMSVLDTRIHQWDSTSQTYKGSLKRKLQKEISAIKVQRDSLKATLSQAGSRTQGNWNDFRQSVKEKYDSILNAMQNLANFNQ